MSKSKAKKVKRQIEKTVKGVPDSELIKLDIACGQRKDQGWTGIDVVNVLGITDIVYDLLKFPWPIKSHSVGEAKCSHFFEHVPAKLRLSFMEEVYRILVDDGKFNIIVPYWASMRAIQDATHEWPPICEASFLYYNKNWLKDTKLDLIYPIKCDFDFSYGYALDGQSQFTNRNEEAKQFAIRNYTNVVSDLIINLIKRKKIDE